jgi:polysaccharide export outer membrane protein
LILCVFACRQTASLQKKRALKRYYKNEFYRNYYDISLPLKKICTHYSVFCVGGVLALSSASLLQAQSIQQVSSSQPSHVLVPGEFIQIKVFQEPDLDTAVRIPGDGHVNFPLIGEVALAGQSVQQATRVIRDRLQTRFLVNPQVSITVVEPAKRLFTVLGQVQRPGTYRFPEQQDLDLLQVIGIAGGYSRLADPGRIIVKRRIDGSEKIFRLDGKRLARGETAEAFQVVSGDVITVSERLF